MTAKTADGPTTIRPRGNSKYFILVALGAALAFVLYLKSVDSGSSGWSFSRRIHSYNPFHTSSAFR